MPSIAWRSAVERRDGPSALLLTRQALPALVKTTALAREVDKGGYILHEPAAKPRIALLATGSEVHIAVEAALALEQRGIAARVVSMPCLERFDRQDAQYRQSVLGVHLPAIAIEAGVTPLWYKYVGTGGRVIGMDRFGESAPAPELFKFFGLTAERIVASAVELLGA